MRVIAAGATDIGRVREATELGLAVLLVEQHVSRVVAVADRTHVIRNGTVALAGTRAELQRLDEAEIRAAYLGEDR